jgi:hypothetical protein
MLTTYLFSPSLPYNFSILFEEVSNSLVANVTPSIKTGIKG